MLLEEEPVLKKVLLNLMVSVRLDTSVIDVLTQPLLWTTMSQLEPCAQQVVSVQRAPRFLRIANQERSTLHPELLALKLVKHANLVNTVEVQIQLVLPVTVPLVTTVQVDLVHQPRTSLNLVSTLVQVLDPRLLVSFLNSTLFQPNPHVNGVPPVPSVTRPK
jgi:hypothetical protein